MLTEWDLARYNERVDRRKNRPHEIKHPQAFTDLYKAACDIMGVEAYNLSEDEADFRMTKMLSLFD